MRFSEIQLRKLIINMICQGSKSEQQDNRSYSVESTTVFDVPQFAECYDILVERLIFIHCAPLRDMNF